MKMSLPSSSKGETSFQMKEVIVSCLLERVLFIYLFKPATLIFIMS